MDINNMEQAEMPLTIFYSFESNTKNIKEIAEFILEEIDSKGIQTSNIEVEEGKNKIVCIQLQVTNTNYGTIKQLKHIGDDLNGFKEFSISTVPADRVRRFWK